MLNKKIALVLAVLFVFAVCSTVFAQNKDADNKKSEVDKAEMQFYATELLRADYKSVDVVAYVDIKEYKVADSVGRGDCGAEKSAGYCLYLLKAEVKEVFKGKVTKKEIEFYLTAESGYPKKHLTGERVVFLELDKEKKTLGVMENSARWIKYDILKKMRRIAKKKKR